MAEDTRVTKQDLADQNFPKVFAEGFAADKPEEQSFVRRDLVPAAAGGQLVARPDVSINAAELDVAKTMSMVTGFFPEFYHNDVARCWAVIQLSKRWTKFDRATNSWIHLDPVYIASQTYLVESNDGRKTVGYSSQFIGSVLDGFVPWAARMRYLYEGQGQERTCTAIAKLRSDPEEFEYTTPPLKLITPKKSPLWQSDPDRQLAYYARRAWARLFAAGVLGGIYDPDELEGEVITGSHRVRDLSHVESLAQRLKRAAPDNGGKGFRPGVVAEGLRAEGPAVEQKRPAIKPKAKKAPKEPSKPKKPVGAAPKARKTKEPREKPRREAAVRAEERPQPPTSMPTTAAKYADYVRVWLAALDTEEAIEARWRSEMRLRNNCGLISDERDLLRAEIDRRIQDLRNAN